MFRSKFLASFAHDQATLRRRVIAVLALLGAANVLVWIWAWASLKGTPLLIETGLLAYTFGLRHAVDADHIAAIDNTTRKLMQSGQRPIGVGLFFSLGHSSIVILLAVSVAISAAALKSHFGDMQAIGGVISTIISASFLLVLAVVNISILKGVIKTFRAVKNGAVLVDADMDMLTAKQGFMTRLLRPLFRVVTKSWHMYLIGFLFGLGFDTVTEIGLFAISSGQASHGMSLSTILIFPALFTAGMSLIDTIDGILMIGAYQWAFKRPVRKLYYNMTVTFISVAVAILIGGIEALALIGDKLSLKGYFWSGVNTLSDNFGMLGYGVIALFVGSWIISMAVYKLKGYDDLAVNVESPLS